MSPASLRPVLFTALSRTRAARAGAAARTLTSSPPGGSGGSGGGGGGGGGVQAFLDVYRSAIDFLLWVTPVTLVIWGIKSYAPDGSPAEVWAQLRGGAPPPQPPAAA